MDLKHYSEQQQAGYGLRSRQKAQNTTEEERSTGATPRTTIASTQGHLGLSKPHLYSKVAGILIRISLIYYRQNTGNWKVQMITITVR